MLVVHVCCLLWWCMGMRCGIVMSPGLVWNRWHVCLSINTPVNTVWLVSMELLFISCLHLTHVVMLLLVTMPTTGRSYACTAGHWPVICSQPRGSPRDLCYTCRYSMYSQYCVVYTVQETARYKKLRLTYVPRPLTPTILDADFKWISSHMCAGDG